MRPASVSVRPGVARVARAMLPVDSAKTKRSCILPTASVRATFFVALIFLLFIHTHAARHLLVMHTRRACGRGFCVRHTITAEESHKGLHNQWPAQKLHTPSLSSELSSGSSAVKWRSSHTLSRGDGAVAFRPRTGVIRQGVSPMAKSYHWYSTLK
eukprot:SAG11_NODE_1448_length_4887_cov_2.165831_2_plen_156_part_00